MLRIDWEEYTTDDFLKLDGELTEYYAQTFGEAWKKYAGYNSVDDVTDFFIAYEGNTPVGICAFKPFPANRTAEIKRLYVKAPFRKSGMGGTILQKVEEAVKRKGYTMSVITTSALLQNSDTVAFYQKRGYKMIPNFGRFQTDPDVVCMQKELK